MTILKRIFIIGAGILIMSASFFLILTNNRMIETVEGKVLNTWFYVRGPVPPSGSVCVVAIDQKSVEQSAPWPWKRDRIARLLESIQAMEPAVIAFDITFSRFSESDSAVKAATDSLARTAERFGRVLFPYYFKEEDKDQVMNVVSPPAAIKETALRADPDIEKRTQYHFIAARELVISSPALTDHGKLGGHISRIIEADKSCRRTAHILFYGNLYLPSMAVLTLKSFWDLNNQDLQIRKDFSIQLGTRSVPIDENGCATIDYYGPEYTFPHISAADFQNNAVRKEDIKGKIVLIGVTVPGISSISGTPFSSQISTVEKLASEIDNILLNKKLKRRIYYRLYEMVAIALIGITSILILILLNWKIAVPGIAGLSAATLLVSFLIFQQFDIWAKLTFPAMIPFLILTAAVFINHKLKKE